MFVEPDECGEEISMELDGTFEEAAEDYDFKIATGKKFGQRPSEEDEFTICFGTNCPKCGSLLEWPQLWRVSK